MKILIVGLNYAPEPVGIGPYTTGMAEALVANGHDVLVVAGKPYYPYWKTDADYTAAGWKRTRENEVGITRCPIYVPALPSGIKRILHHLSFAVSALVPACLQARRMKADIVLAVAPSLLSAPVARLAAWIGGAKMWLHIQDLEVEAAFAMGLMQEGSKLGSLARYVEAGALRLADMVSTISPQMRDKIRAKTATPVVEFRNWANVEDIGASAAASSYRKEWDLGDRHVALYSGNLANKQGIEIIGEAARLLQHREDLLFIVCGDGANREALVKRAEGISNIRFYGLQPKERLGELLSIASVHLLPQVADAADLVLPSKLTNMLASGRAVVATAAHGTGLADEVEDCGVVVPPGDAMAFANAITSLLDSPIDRRRYGEAARQRAKDRWSKSAILTRFEADLLGLADTAIQ